MKVRFVMPLLLFVSACEAAPRAQPSTAIPVARVFGPVVARDAIRGREEDGDHALLLVNGALVRIDLEKRQASRTPIQTDPGTDMWGLARLADGSIWTLTGRHAVGRLDADGRVSHRFPLAEAHAGVFAAGDRLVYQRAVPLPSEPALRAGLPGGEQVPWSDLRVRRFPGIDRAQVAALSLVACGRGRVAERACWFPDEAAVAIIDPDGRTRRVELPGLASVPPEILLTSENPRRPVRDAYIDATRRIWVLSTGEPDPGAGDVPGAWILARYLADGTPDGLKRLAEPARLILRVDGARVMLLAGSGHVGEVASW
jgi:hypothetical protein